MVWLIAHLPGFVVRKRDEFSHSHAQEIDLAVWNDQLPGGFPSIGSKVLIECKNTGRRVDASDVGWFYWKMRFGDVSDGILATSAGITGDQRLLTAAREIVALANAEGRHIMVVELDALAAIRTRQELRDLLIDCQLGLATRS